MRYVEQIFNDESIDVDGNRYYQCIFNRCKIIFSGQAGAAFDCCTFNQCNWVFAKGAEQTIQYLAALYSGLAPAGQQIVEALFDSIRQGGAGNGLQQDDLVPATRR